MNPAQNAATPGWQMVPVEPTPEMLAAAAPRPRHWPPVGEDRGMDAAVIVDQMTAASTYRTMIAAAPTPPDHPTILDGYSHKPYPCFERPMTGEEISAMGGCDTIDRAALREKLDALIAAASREWGAGSTEHNLVRDVSDAVARMPALARAGGDGWRPIAEAPRDGTWIIAIIAPNRGRYLEHQAGRAFVIRHEGVIDTYDMGWSVFPGFGGSSDHDFTVFRPLPPAPNTEGEHG